MNRKITVLFFFLTGCLAGCMRFLNIANETHASIKQYSFRVNKYALESMIDKIAGSTATGVTIDKFVGYELPNEDHKFFTLKLVTEQYGALRYLFYFNEDYDHWLTSDSCILVLREIQNNCDQYYLDSFNKKQEQLKQDFIDLAEINFVNKITPYLKEYQHLSLHVLKEKEGGRPKMIVLNDTLNHLSLDTLFFGEALIPPERIVSHDIPCEKK